MFTRKLYLAIRAALILGLIAYNVWLRRVLWDLEHGPDAPDISPPGTSWPHPLRPYQ